MSYYINYREGEREYQESETLLDIVGLSVKVHAPTCFPTCAPTYAPTCTPTLMCRGGDYNAFHLSNLEHLRPLDPNTETWTKIIFLLLR